MSNEPQTPSASAQTTAPATDEQGRDRPDLRGPRGNQDVEQVDVDRGRGKIERIVSW